MRSSAVAAWRRLELAGAAAGTAPSHGKERPADAAKRLTRVPVVPDWKVLRQLGPRSGRSFSEPDAPGLSS
jgi:hypothetical protein